MTRMAHDLIHPPKARGGERIAVVSPSFAAAGAVIPHLDAGLAIVCVGVPFGHTRPQWLLPHGGAITVDGSTRRVVARYA